MKGLFVILLVLGVLIGGLFTLFTTRHLGMPNKDVMDRAKKRELEQEVKDDKDSKDA